MAGQLAGAEEAWRTEQLARRWVRTARHFLALRLPYWLRRLLL